MNFDFKISRVDCNYNNVNKVIKKSEKKRKKQHVQQTFGGSNTYGSFTTAVSNSFFCPLEKTTLPQIWDNLGWFSSILTMVYCVYSLESPR